MLSPPFLVKKSLCPFFVIILRKKKRLMINRFKIENPVISIKFVVKGLPEEIIIKRTSPLIILVEKVVIGSFYLKTSLCPLFIFGLINGFFLEECI